MKKILLVGHNYNYETKVSEKYRDTLFIAAREIDHDNNPQRKIAMVEMVDAVLFMDNNHDSSFNIAALLLGKDICVADDYPVEEKGEEA